MQREAPLYSTTHPVGQAVHVELPSGTSWKYPGTHSAQADMPVAFATVPLLHGMHLAASSKSTYFPGAQPEQRFIRVALAKCPCLHSVQFHWPSRGCTLPGTQG